MKELTKQLLLTGQPIVDELANLDPEFAIDQVIESMLEGIQMLDSITRLKIFASFRSHYDLDTGEPHDSFCRFN